MEKNIEELISIIIPVYNVQDYLKQCLDSVCNQTYQNIEIIVINDGSTDASVSIISEYQKKDSRIILINQENRGISEVRNTGIQSARGPYIMFVDGDDWIDKETCEVAYHALIEENVDVVMWGYDREYETASKPTFPLGTDKRLYDRNSIKYLYQQMVGPVREQMRYPQLSDSCITVWGKLYKKKFIENNRFVDIKKIGTEDTLFNIEVFSIFKSAVYLPSTFYHYRKTNDSSITHKYKKNLVEQWQELYTRIERHLKETKAISNLYVALSNRKCMMLIGLGISIVDDCSLTKKEQKDELKRILNLPQYKKALKKLSCKYLPVHWKIYFICMKIRWIQGVYLLLKIMNNMRRA